MFLYDLQRNSFIALRLICGTGIIKDLRTLKVGKKFGWYLFTQ